MDSATHDKIPLAQLLVLRSIQTALELAAVHRCPVGRTPFLDPSRLAWTSGLEVAAPAICEEYRTLEARLTRLPALEELSPEQRFVSNDKNWKSLIVRGYDGEPSWLARRFLPATLAALEAVPGVRLAFFSVLEPNKKLPAHRGPYKGILRCHLGVRIPTESAKCRIRVGKEWRSWEKGKVMVFDDSYEHEVDNATSERRVVLFIDFVRPLGAPFGAINRAILKRVFDRSSFALTLAERQRAWEAALPEEVSEAAE
jgi:ornithine lipid ester-linked acyl 2-hydroxylase